VRITGCGKLKKLLQNIKIRVYDPKVYPFVVARRTAKNSLEKSISLEKARTGRGRLQKYWDFRSTLGRGPRVDNALRISGPILTVLH
jgi:hypothetical protein